MFVKIKVFRDILLSANSDDFLWLSNTTNGQNKWPVLFWHQWLKSSFQALHSIDIPQ